MTDFRCGLYRSLSSIGSINAAVLPVPVAAHAHKSRPARASGIQAAWIGVGSMNPQLLIA